MKNLLFIFLFLFINTTEAINFKDVINKAYNGNSGDPNYKHDISICCIFQNEAPYLKEWIEFHRIVGVTHFYLYNHKSTDHYLEILNPYINEGIVELVNLPIDNKHDQQKGFVKLQSECYLKALIKTIGLSKWLIPLDVDEFIFPVENISLPQFLKDYESLGGVAVNWQIFGTSNVYDIPPGKLMIELLTACSPVDYSSNHYIKTILRPEYVATFSSPHFANFIPGYFAVNSDYVPIHKAITPYVAVNKIRINHYWSKTEKFFKETKLEREIRWNYPIDNLIEQARIANLEQNTLILRYVDELNKRMGFNSSKAIPK